MTHTSMTMSEAHAVGGKSDGSLHQVTPVELATQVLEAVRDRNELDTSHVDDVVLGCLSPVGEQGSGIARVAVRNANYSETAPGQLVHRFSPPVEPQSMTAAQA